MVDVSDKPATARRAVARGWVAMAPETLALVAAGTAAKGDVLGVARLAGIMAAKRTAELIPLCHPLPLSKRRGRPRARPAAGRRDDRGQGRHHRPDRRRDGGADRGLGRGAHRLRHAEGGRPRHGDRRDPAGAQGRRQVRALRGAADGAADPRRRGARPAAARSSRRSAPRRCRSPRPPAASSPATWWPPAPSRPSPPRRWTATRSAPPTRVPGARLRVVGVSAAGAGFRRRLGPGEAVRIFTGAPVPDGRRRAW